MSPRDQDLCLLRPNKSVINSSLPTSGCRCCMSVHKCACVHKLPACVRLCMCGRASVDLTHISFKIRGRNKQTKKFKVPLQSFLFSETVAAVSGNHRSQYFP